MFDNLTSELTQAFSGIRTRKLTENNVAEAIREVRTALLEADVALEVVIPFVEAVRKKSVGREFVASVRPGDMFVKFVHCRGFLLCYVPSLVTVTVPPACVVIVGSPVSLSCSFTRICIVVSLAK